MKIESRKNKAYHKAVWCIRPRRVTLSGLTHLFMNYKTSHTVQTWILLENSALAPTRVEVKSLRDSGESVVPSLVY